MLDSGHSFDIHTAKESPVDRDRFDALAKVFANRDSRQVFAYILVSVPEVSM
jgi:hypothetical protein